MNDLLEVVMKEIELLEYFPADSDQMEEFMQNIEKIRSSSVFKR